MIHLMIYKISFCLNNKTSNYFHTFEDLKLNFTKNYFLEIKQKLWIIEIKLQI